MFDIIRKNQRVLMSVVVILTILAFTFFYTHTDSVGQGARQAAGWAYGQAIPAEKISRLAENYQLAVVLGLSDLLGSLGGNAQNESVAFNNFILNQLIIEHKAKDLGVAPKDDQVARAITECSLFQTNGHFDITRYNAFVKTQLIPRGIRERQLEEVVRDSLRVATIRKIVTGSVAVSEQEVRNAFREYQKQDLQVAKFDLSQFLEKAQVPEDEIKQLYQKNSPDLKSQEMRSVRYVVFEVPKEVQSLHGKERVEAIQAVADRAAAFADSISNSKVPLEEAARQAHLTVETSSLFNSVGVGENSEKFRTDLPNLVSSIFQLTQEKPNSEALEGANKAHFYVVELASLQPSRPLNFEEVRPQLLNTLRTQAATKLLYEEGYAAHALISKDLRAGKSFEDAATQAGGQVHTMHKTALHSSTSPEDILYNQTALFLSPGQVSALQTTLNAVFAVFVQDRDAVDPAELAASSNSIKAQLLKNKQLLLFMEWLQTAHKEAKIRVNDSGA